jgi:hypothetical protein
MTNPISLAIVVGAGASKEANLPVGAELKHKIASALDIRFERGGFERVGGDERVTEAFRLIAATSDGRQGDIHPFLRASWMIRDAMPQAASIDNFIDAHRANGKVAECGKLAIARCILEAEARSVMRVDRSNINNKIDFKGLESTWYNSFFRLLVENCQLQDIPERLSSIAIITFNYDGCIEHYLHEALKNYYDIEIQEATALLSNLRIFHPYGSLGPLPWTTRPHAIDFGVTPSRHQLVEIARELKTFTEGTDETHSEIVAIRSTLRSANRVAFLGFAFNPQNLDLLYGPAGQTISMRDAPVFATALGLSTSDIEIISHELHTMAGYEPHGIRLRRDLTCAQLLQEYGRSLAIR